jgi:hypothetical protein
MARLESLETEVQHGFRQLQARIDSKVDGLGSKLDQQLATILARLPGASGP